MNHSELFDSVLGAFKREGWSYSEVEGREVVTCGFEAHHTRVTLHVQAFSEMRLVSVVSESSLTTDDPVKRERLAELVMRVNHTLSVGAFEMDWDRGQVIFRVTNIFPDPSGDIDIIASLVHNVVGEMDRISPLEILIHKAEGPELAGIDIPTQMARKDLLPEIPDLSE